MPPSALKIFVPLILIALCGAGPTAAKGKRYYNSEFGVAMTFPAGSQVCPGDSGGHVHGYYALYRSPFKTCDDMRGSHPDSSVTGMGVFAEYNASFESAQTIFDDYCKVPDAKPALSPAQRHHLSIKGHTVRSCSQTKPDGIIEVTVIAENGRWKEESTAHPVPYIYYLISLSTNADHLKHDLPMFEAYLHSLRIYPRRPSR